MTEYATPHDYEPADPLFRVDDQGYERIIQYFKCEKHSFRHHQLLSIADGACPYEIFSEGYHTHHKNRIPWDNRIDNLEVISPEEHAKEHEVDREHNPKYTDEELLSWLHSFVEHFGIVPTAPDLNGWPGPSEVAYRNRYGTFPKALRAAGYTPRSEQCKTD